MAGLRLISWLVAGAGGANHRCNALSSRLGYQVVQTLVGFFDKCCFAVRKGNVKSLVLFSLIGGALCFRPTHLALHLWTFPDLSPA